MSDTVIDNLHVTSKSHRYSPITQVREWGMERCHFLPHDALRACVGSQDDCAVRLADPSVFPLHAHLSRERHGWLIRALGDAAELWRDGARMGAFSLDAGVEVGVGRTTLVAENPWWISVRTLCARILGWDWERTLVVDHALRSIRRTLIHRAPLVLRGESDMVPIAHTLHRRVLGPDRPFVIYDPYRQARAASVRAARSCATMAAAVDAAAGGSLCVRASRPPKDLAALVERTREPSACVQLVLCWGEGLGDPVFFRPIEVPTLSTRVHEVPRIIDEYAQDAIESLGAPPGSFTSADHRWVLDHVAPSLAEIEKATVRRVALRVAPSMSAAAARLGMAPVSLWRWLERRRS